MLSNPPTPRPILSKPRLRATVLRARACSLACALLLLAASALLASCGSTTPHKPSATSSAATSSTATTTDIAAHSPPSQRLTPSTPIAKVGTQAITWQMLRHQTHVEPYLSDIPEPPDFSACVAHLASSAFGRGKSTAALKEECRKTYSDDISKELPLVLHVHWMLGEGAERGLKLNQAELQKELRAITKGFGARMTANGQTRADVRRMLSVQQFTDQLFALVKARTPRVSGALVARYYATHKQGFTLPEERDIHIIRTASSGAAQKVREEIKAGKSFAEVVKGIGLPQPIRTKEGTFLKLKPNFFSEPVLSEPIFKARPHVLSEPIRISLGYYVFEVIRIHPPRLVSLAEAKRSIQALLPEELHKQVLSRTVNAFRKKWTERTICEPGFVVKGCSQYKAPASALPADQYSF
jgi:PPIC-type PPIASE domain